MMCNEYLGIERSSNAIGNAAPCPFRPSSEP
jgi:hypothetical protein